MILEETEIPGVRLLVPRVARDVRGDFVKTYHAPTFAEFGLGDGFAEHYHSTSRKGVIRGMHFQTPPHHHDKLVVCTMGRVLDVVVDLRKGSSTFRGLVSRELNGAECTGLVIPKGCAHGFLSLTDDATLHYYVTTPYAADHDSGVRFDSIGFEWPVDDPLTSERDRGFPSLETFDSPFWSAPP